MTRQHFGKLTQVGAEFGGRKPVRKEVQEKDDVSGTGSGEGFRVRIGRSSSWVDAGDEGEPLG